MSRDLHGREVPPKRPPKPSDKAPHESVCFTEATNVVHERDSPRQSLPRPARRYRPRKRRFPIVLHSPTPQRCDRYSTKRFEGACLDGGATRSVIGKRQALAYCRTFCQEFRLRPSDVTFIFGNGSSDSLGKIDIRLPTPQGTFIPLSIDVVSADIPLLLGLDIMDKESLVADNVLNVLDCRSSSWKLPIQRKYNHMFVCWGPQSIGFLSLSSKSSTSTSSTLAYRNCTTF